LSEEVIDEEVVGRHESGIMLEEGMITGGRSYCANCKRNVHCHVVVEKGKAEVIFTCRNDDCECRCRTHFACKRCGYLHPYGVKCDRVEEERKYNVKADNDFREFMDTWRESQKVEEPKITKPEKPKEPTD